jgi:hypothetical protein
MSSPAAACSRTPTMSSRSYGLATQLPRTLLTAVSRLCFSQSHSYFTTADLSRINSSWRQSPWGSRPVIFFQLNTCGHSPYVTSSLARGWVSRLQLLLTFARAVILKSESSETHDHVLLSQIRDSPNLEGQVPVFISPRGRMAQVYTVTGLHFVASYDSQVFDTSLYSLNAERALLLTDLLLLRACLLRPLPSNGSCCLFRGRCLATGLHAKAYKKSNITFE